MKVFVTGGAGMLGQAVIAAAANRPDIDILAPTRADLDLTDRGAVDAWFRNERVDAVVHLAARVGGIQANIAAPADFYLDNTLINANVIDGAHRHDVQRLINIGSSCMYPRGYETPLKESDLLAAPLEPTNEGYALSKIGAARHCSYLAAQYGRAYRTLIPCNLYGPHDTFAPERSHLVAAVIHKLAEALRANADTVTIWGDGEARREFLYVEDLAGYILAMIGIEESLPDMMNVGAGDDWTVNEYHQLAAQVIGYEGGFVHDTNRPVGMRRKLLDSALANTHGWHPETSLLQGLALTYRYYQEHERP